MGEASAHPSVVSTPPQRALEPRRRVWPWLETAWRKLLAIPALRTGRPGTPFQPQGWPQRAGHGIPGTDGLGVAGQLGRCLEDADSLEQGLPEVARWLERSFHLPVVIVLAREGNVEELFAWPSDGPVARSVTAATRGPLEEGTVLSTVVREKRSVHQPVVMPGFSLFRTSDLPAVRSIAVVPLVAGGDGQGALIVYSPAPARIGPRLLAEVEGAGSLVALVVANARLRQVVSAMQSAQEAARLREELLAALSHDMQTPLAVLLGSIKALQAVDDLAPKHRAGLYESMARRGAQLQRLVEQFLDYSRLEAGRPIEVRPSPTDVATAIAKLETDIGWRRPLALDVADELPSAFVDPDRLDQVLANLVSNALKFSPVDSPITVQARAGDDTVQIVVADQGRGMAPAEVEKGFLKFQRGAGAEDTPGTGLGLYVSRAVIEAQGGQLYVESVLGRGSRFTVVLPCQPPADRES